MPDDESWWRRWHEQDFSWEGLANRPWEGWIRTPDGQIVKKGVNVKGVQATLQDCWRDQEGDLIASPVGDSGRRYTRAHMPMRWEDGEPTGKATWRAGELDALVAPRIAAAAPGRPAPLDGVIFNADIFTSGFKCGRRAHSHHRAALSVTGRWASFEKGATFRGLRFTSGCSFQHARFAGEPVIDRRGRASARARTCFHGAIFQGEVSFERCRFASGVDFAHAVFSHGVSFRQAQFSIVACFEHAKARKIANFDEAAFLSNAVFTDAAFDDGQFTNCMFGASARFDGAIFSTGCAYERATFVGEAVFENAIFARDAAFERAIFRDIAKFKAAAFCGRARFAGACFVANAAFTYAAFCEPICFADTVFGGAARFNGLGALLKSREEIQPIRLKHMGPNRSSSEGEMLTPEIMEPRAQRVFASANFHDAVFLGLADFSNRDILEPSDFEHAMFCAEAGFHGSDLHQGVSFHGAAFERAIQPDKFFETPPRALARLFVAENHSACRWVGIEDNFRKSTGAAPISGADLYQLFTGQAAFRIEFEQWRLTFEGQRNQAAMTFMDQDLETRNVHFARVEDAFRTLKQAMEDNRNRNEEAYFFTHELRARRRRREAAVPVWERGVSFAYQGASKYGSSIIRPLAMLCCWVSVFTLAYALMCALPARAPTMADWLGAASFSSSRILPFGPWATAPPAGSAMAELLDDTPALAHHAAAKSAKGATPPTASPPGATALVTRLLASLESAGAAVLAFLTALAVRRRFQIN